MTDRTKVSDVAVAEAMAWRRGLDAANAMVEHALKVRYGLLTDGFPAAHPLCKELDATASRWALRRDQFRDDLIAHCKANMLDVPAPARKVSP